MTDDLWDYADLKALGYAAHYYFGRSDLLSLLKMLGLCSINDWECSYEDHRALVASAIRYGAEAAERDLLRNARYYTVNSGGHIDDDHDTLGEARDCSKWALGSARDAALDRNEWPDWVEPIEYGYLVPVARVSKVNCQTDESGHVSCDYRLEPVR